MHNTVYVWDGAMMTHDDVRGQLLPDLSNNSDDLTAFEIADYTVVGPLKVTMHDAKVQVVKPGMSDPYISPFVQNIVAAINMEQS